MLFKLSKAIDPLCTRKCRCTLLCSKVSLSRTWVVKLSTDTSMPAVHRIRVLNFSPKSYAKAHYAKLKICKSASQPLLSRDGQYGWLQ